MIAASVGKKQISRSLLFILAAIVVVVAGIFIVSRMRGTKTIGEIAGASAEEREAYLISLGIQVDSTSSIAEVGVPAEFDERFTSYNEMLRLTGFDLEGLKGAVVKKCTYTVTNRQDLGASVSAVLLIHDNKIVGGHLIDNATGQLFPLISNTADTAAEPATDTILPAETPVDETAVGLGEEAQEVSYPTD